MRFWRSLLSYAILVYCPAVLAISSADLPQFFQARFELYKSGIPIAETHYQFKKQADSAMFSANTKLTGFAAIFSKQRIEEKSSLRFIKQNIQSQHYSYLQTGDDASSINSEFNHKQRTINTLVNQQKSITVSYEKQVWDNLSILLALIIESQSEKSTIQLNALDKGQLKKYQLTNKGPREIEVDDDVWVKTTVWSRRDANKEVIFYLNPNNYYFPVKIEEFRSNKLRGTLLLKDLKWQP